MWGACASWLRRQRRSAGPQVVSCACRPLFQHMFVLADARPCRAGGEGEVNVFPRFKERDPYRVLGVDKDVRSPSACTHMRRAAMVRMQRRLSRSPCAQATYEEIQEARNFLVNEHRVRRRFPSASRRQQAHRVCDADAPVPAKRFNVPWCIDFCRCSRTCAGLR